MLATIGMTFIIIGSRELSSRLDDPTDSACREALRGVVDLGFRDAARASAVRDRAGLRRGGGPLSAHRAHAASASGCGRRSTTAPPRPRSASTPGSSTRRPSRSAAGLAAFGGILGAEMLPIDPYYALRYMVLFLMVVAVGGSAASSARSPPLSLLGIVDTAARYLVPGLRDDLLLSGDRWSCGGASRTAFSGEGVRWPRDGAGAPRLPRAPSARLVHRAGADVHRRGRGFFVFPYDLGLLAADRRS